MKEMDYLFAATRPYIKTPELTFKLSYGNTLAWNLIMDSLKLSEAFEGARRFDIEAESQISSLFDRIPNPQYSEAAFWRDVKTILDEEYTTSKAMGYQINVHKNLGTIASGPHAKATIGDNRPVKARDIIGSSVVTGDNNLVSTHMQQITLPPPDTVDVKAELAALQELVSKLNLQDRGKLNRAIEDATEETGKADPDKEEVAGAMGRIVKYAKAADDFDEHVTNLLPHIAALGSWLGTHGHALLTAVGIAS
jgi:hypothetical protein